MAPTRSSPQGGRARLYLLPLLALVGVVVWVLRVDDPAPEPPAPPQQEPISYLVGPNAGRWHEPRSNATAAGLTDEQREEVAELEALGYAEGVHEATDAVPAGVTRHDPARARAGINLYTSAHEAEARLIDMEGRELHRWSLPFWDVWPDYPHRNKLATFWRRTHLFPNGDLLAIYEGLGIIKIDKDSKLLWSSALRAHHDIEVLPDGTIYTLSREAHFVPDISESRPVLEDFISILEPNGEERRRISLIDAMAGSEFEQDWSERIHLGGDLFHTNTLEILDGRLADRNPAFAAGNYLVSMLLLDLVAVIDAKTEKVIWGRVGPYAAQHDPQEVDGGAVMVFDNRGAGEASRILELDPATWEVTWSYQGTAEEPFYSETCGLAQRLENGNTLITETDYGRAFEITREGELVWEFHNPHRAGEGGRYIATLMELIRLPEDLPLPWIAR